MWDGGSRMLIDAVLQTLHACALMLPFNGLPARINTALLPHEHRLRRCHTSVTSCRCRCRSMIVFIEKKCNYMARRGPRRRAAVFPQSLCWLRGSLLLSAAASCPATACRLFLRPDNTLPALARHPRLLCKASN